jgi:CRISPR/Cas system-associated exonuclease Cas4 (RecB family)
VSTQITGTLVRYYAICPREAWLTAHKIEKHLLGHETYEPYVSRW